MYSLYCRHPNISSSSQNINKYNLYFQTIFLFLMTMVPGIYILYILPRNFFIFCPALKMHILWCRTDICSCKLSAKVSLMLDNLFPVPSLCKLNHTSICFIQISTTKITCKHLTPLRESHYFLK